MTQRLAPGHLDAQAMGLVPASAQEPPTTGTDWPELTKAVLTLMEALGLEVRGVTGFRLFVRGRQAVKITVRRVVQQQEPVYEVFDRLEKYQVTFKHEEIRKAFVTAALRAACGHDIRHAESLEIDAMPGIPIVRVRVCLYAHVGASAGVASALPADGFTCRPVGAPKVNPLREQAVYLKSRGCIHPVRRSS